MSSPALTVPVSIQAPRRQVRLRNDHAARLRRWCGRGQPSMTTFIYLFLADAVASARAGLAPPPETWATPQSELVAVNLTMSAGQFADWREALESRGSSMAAVLEDRIDLLDEAHGDPVAVLLAARQRALQSGPLRGRDQ